MIFMTKSRQRRQAIADGISERMSPVDPDLDGHIVLDPNPAKTRLAWALIALFAVLPLTGLGVYLSL